MENKMLEKYQKLLSYFKNSNWKNFYELGLLEITVIFCIISIILSLIFNVKLSSNKKELQIVIQEINLIQSAIHNFKMKYDFLPGDIQQTQVYNLSLRDTDGNANDIIEDEEQSLFITNRTIKYNGEVANFFPHLYNSGFLKNNGKMYPYLDILKTGIIVFNNKNVNWYHLSVKDAKRNQAINTINNFTPYDAYLLDKKMDDGSPYTGRILSTGGEYINYKNEIDKHCANKKEYLVFYKSAYCQLIMKL